MSNMKREWLDKVEQERMMREAGITQSTLDKMQIWINNINQEKGKTDD